MIAGPEVPVTYTRDWGGDRLGRCIAVVRPKNTEEVAQICRLCCAAKIGIVPQGGHTGLVGGAQRADGDCVILSTELMNRITELNADNLSCTVDAGVILETLQTTLAESGLQFGVSIGSQGSAQIGGLISTNAGGVRVIQHGMMASQVLGLEMVLADGRVLSSITGLHKDNRGPDPLRLAIGGEGVFGIVTKASLRVMPMHQSFATAYIGCGSFSDAFALLRHVRRDSHEVLSAFEVMSEACMPLAHRAHADITPPVNAPVHVLVQLSSAAILPLDDILANTLTSAIEAGLATDVAIAQSTAQVAKFWAIREGLVEGQSKRGYHVRSDVSVRLGDVPRTVDALETMLSAEFPDWIAQSYGHMGDGNLHFNALPPETMAEPQARAIGKEIEARIYAIITALHGSFSAEHGIGRTKAAWFRDTLPQRHALLVQLKDAFDPAHAMNPGCLLTNQDLSK